MKSLIHASFIILAGLLLPLKMTAQMDVCMAIDGNTMTFYYTAAQDYSTPPFNFWNSQLFTVRYPNTVTVNWSNLQNYTSFSFVEDPATLVPANPGDGFLYKVFVANGFAMVENFSMNNLTQVFSVDLMANTGVTFELITGNIWTLFNNGEAAVNHALFGNIFNTYTTSCGSQTLSSCPTPTALSATNIGENSAQLN